MTLLEIIQAAIDAEPRADGLLNIQLGCGCHHDELAPCMAPDVEYCALAKSEVLKEPRGDCDVGDLWFTKIDDLLEKGATDGQS